MEKESPVNKHTVDSDLCFKVSRVIKVMSFEGDKSSLSTGQAQCLHFLLTQIYKVRLSLPIHYLWLLKEMDISANLSHVEAQAFVSRALTDHTNEASLRPTRISPDMSLRRPESIIQPDWLALLEGMILACPAASMATAQGHRGKEGCHACYLALLIQMTGKG